MSLQIESSPEEQGYEGPEKNLQVIFSKIYFDTGTLLSISQERWQEMLNYAKCKILTTKENEKCIAYILSESSLFVYDDRIILKTCGTTPLLNALDDIILIGKELNLKPAAVLYWRKNFSNPHLQDPVHQNFENEVNFLDEHLGGDSRLPSSGLLRKIISISIILNYYQKMNLILFLILLKLKCMKFIQKKQNNFFGKQEQ